MAAIRIAPHPQSGRKAATPGIGAISPNVSHLVLIIYLFLRWCLSSLRAYAGYGFIERLEKETPSCERREENDSLVWRTAVIVDYGAGEVAQEPKVEDWDHVSRLAIAK